MVAAKMLPEAEDVSKITTKAVSYTHLVFFFDQFLKTTYANKLVYTLFACMVTGWLAILCVNLVKKEYKQSQKSRCHTIQDRPTKKHGKAPGREMCIRDRYTSRTIFQRRCEAADHQDQ